MCLETRSRDTDDSCQTLLLIIICVIKLFFVTTFFLFVFLIKIGILSTPATIRRGSDSLFVDKQNP